MKTKDMHFTSPVVAELHSSMRLQASCTVGRSLPISCKYTTWYIRTFIITAQERRPRTAVFSSYAITETVCAEIWSARADWEGWRCGRPHMQTSTSARTLKPIM